MSPEKEKKIFNDFPKIFPGGRNVDMRCNLMCFGIEPDDGWYDIIYDMCEHIQKRVDNYIMGNKDGMWKIHQVEAVQVKEKLGTLRFYFNGGCLVNQADPTMTKDNGVIEGIVSHASFLSSRYCECCGSRGRVRGHGWVRCLCNDCAKEQNYPTDEEEADRADEQDY